MARHFLSYWKPETADANLKRGRQMDHAASNQYRSVEPADTVWIVTVRQGELFLLGKVEVAQILGQDDAVKELDDEDLWQADFHILGDSGTSREIRHISIAHLARDLRFDSSSGRDRLMLTERGVNPQQLQTLRALTPDSASILRQALGEETPTRKMPTNSERSEPLREEHELEISEALNRLQHAGRHSSDLLKGMYRNSDTSEIPLNGLCYILAECMYHLFPNVFTPYRISWGDGSTHWFLRHSDGTVFDAIQEEGREVCEPEEYASARRVAFFTKAPSKRARTLLERAGF